MVTTLTIPRSPKRIRETLCEAQCFVRAGGGDGSHIDLLQELIDECDRHRPLGPDGKHGERHTPTCGCDL